MLIYRVEHSVAKIGPFMFSSNFCAEFENRVGMDHHPNPFDDGLRHRFREAMDHLGCSSMEQLKHWFAPFIAELKNLNMIIRVFDVNDDDVMHGKTQVAFWRKDIDIVKEMTVDALA